MSTSTITPPAGYTSWLDWGVDQFPWGWGVTLQTAALGNEAINAERRAIRDAARAELADLREWKDGGERLVAAVMETSREIVKCADEQGWVGVTEQVDALRKQVAEYDAKAVQS